MLDLLILCCIRFPDIKIFSGTRSLTNLLYADIIHPLYLITSELCFIENHFSSRTHLTYQFLIHVLLHVERNSALSLRPYHIEFDTHLESLLFHIFSFVTPSENATLGCPSKQRSPNCQRWCTMQSRICKQNNSDNTDHFLHVLLLKKC